MIADDCSDNIVRIFEIAKIKHVVIHISGDTNIFQVLSHFFGSQGQLNFSLSFFNNYI